MTLFELAHHHHHHHLHQGSSRRQQLSHPSDFTQQQRQHHRQHRFDCPITTTSVPPAFVDDLSHQQYTDSVLASALDSESVDFSQTTSDHHFMPTAPHYSPPIRVQLWTPGPGGFDNSDYSSGLDDSHPYQHQPPWISFGLNTEHLSPSATRQQLPHHRNQLSHKRNLSGSTIGSVGPPSPLTPTTTFPRVPDSELPSSSTPEFEKFKRAYFPGNSHSKPLLSSSQIPYQTAFLAPTFQDYPPSTYNADAIMAAQTAMRQVLMAQQDTVMGGDVSSAPRSAFGTDEYEDNSKVSMESRNIIPKLDRTMSDVFQDELYNPRNAAVVPVSPPPANQISLLSPYNKGVFSERLQAANSARSASPAAPISRERSPFRQGCEQLAEAYLSSNQTVNRLVSASQMREQQKAQADADALAKHQSKGRTLIAPNTISPKEAFLDYKETQEDAKMHLFPQEKSESRISMKTHKPSPLKLVKQESSQGDTDDSVTERSYTSTATTRRQSSSEYSTTSGPIRPRSSVAFAPPALPGRVQIPQQYPFISQSRSQSSSMRSTSDQAPDFPAHLTSMDTTKSDSGTKSDNGRSEDSPERQKPEVQRPANTMADSGTYSCTYHGCTMRFATAIKLQKHKREGHRQSTPHTPKSATATGAASPGGGSDASVANRNSQAGPHRCDRINPSTGKPCNSIFSRPYDLTRHEDTIHNARKQKVRCQLCTEEKTFSRNDALTRHMRVVHPEVDFPGKTKRKGGL